jgi:PAS domain S-box-containing protein
LETSGTPIFDLNGAFKGYRGINRDITGRKRAEEALKKSEADLERAQRIAALGSWEWDLTTNTLSGSREYYRIFDAEPSGPVPFEHFASMVHPDDRGRVDAAARNIGPGNSPGSFEFRLLLPGNRVKYIHAFSGIVKDERGRPVKVFGTMQDITERKRIEEELNTAKQQAELYLDLLSHDINNMHQIALGYLELARGMPPGVQQEEMIEKPIEVLQRSTLLIKNVRKLQKLHEDAFQTELVDVRRVLVDVQREYGAVPGKTVTLNMNDYGYCHVSANDLLHDVFANLVGNAIKHTGKQANIVIDLDVVMSEGRRYCRVMVEDDGPGVPDDFKGKIFNRLLKGTSKAKGMGLGLYLVKTLVDSYGGRVWVEDRIQGDHSKGARFVVMLPSVENQP